MTPSPPAWAMAMASFDSVTVSMAAEMIGMDSIDIAGNARGRRNLGRQHGRSAGLHQHVIKSQIFRNLAGSHGPTFQVFQDSLELAAASNT